ncbi:hypothetical protein MMC18_008157 [Xylographa bjoerkii]|nr:hypothetical protein [Xylographa bjoerkii]
MVGVPTSKGCQNCRSRKKGCDLARPACGRCLKLGLTCSGYRRDVLFVQLDPSGDSSAAKTENVQKQTSRADVELALVPRPDSHIFDLPHALIQLASQQQYKALFWDAYIPQRSGAPTLTSGGLLPPSVSWLQTACGESDGSATTSNGVLALSIARLARISRSRDLLETATRLHGFAIQQVRQRLAQHHVAHDDSLLASIMLLASYEVYEGGSEGQRASTWISHVRGATEMVALRGVLGASSTFAMKLYLGAWYNELVDAITVRRDISSGPFFSLATLDFDQQTADEIELYEVMSHLPAILAAIESIEVQNLHTTPIQVAARCITFSDRLATWQGKVQAHRRERLCWTESSQLYEQVGGTFPDYTFHESMGFADLSTAHLQLLYWTGLLLLKSVLFVTCQSLRKVASNTEVINAFASVLKADDSSTCHELAWKIAQSVEYFTQAENGLMGLQLLAFPMTVAQGCLRHMQSKDLAWFDLIYQRLETRDIRLQGFLDDMSAGRRSRIVRT